MFMLSSTITSPLQKAVTVRRKKMLIRREQVGGRELSKQGLTCAGVFPLSSSLVLL